MLIREYRLVLAALPLVAVLANFAMLDLGGQSTSPDDGVWRTLEMATVPDKSQLDDLEAHELWWQKAAPVVVAPPPPVEAAPRAEYKLVGTVMVEDRYIVHLSSGPGNSVRLAQGEMTPDGYRLDEVNDNSVTLTRRRGDDVEVLYLYQRNIQDDQG